MMRWWYSERRRGYHPDGAKPQPLWCALVSFVLGPNVRSGSHWHTDGTNYWWECRRCGAGDSSL